jgi:uncharacterized membrane protein
MKLLVKENFLDPILINFLSDKFLYETPHIWGHSPKGDRDAFYATHLDSNDSILSYIHQKVDIEILDLQTEIQRVYINIQHNIMEGEFHYDDGDITALLMITPDPKQGGQFEYKDQNSQIQTIPYKQNKLIVFNGIEHRGCCYVDNKPRITLAYKLNIIK